MGSGEAAARMETARLLSLASASRGSARHRYEDDVIRLDIPVARDVARRYHGRGIPAEDIDQVAFLGLVKAVRGYDASVGDEFLSYAVPTVRGEVRRHFRDAGWAVRPPRAVQEIQTRVTDAESELAQAYGRVPGAAEIARHLDVPLALVLAAQLASAVSGRLRSMPLDPTATRSPRPTGWAVPTLPSRPRRPDWP